MRMFVKLGVELRPNSHTTIDSLGAIATGIRPTSPPATPTTAIIHAAETRREVASGTMSFRGLANNGCSLKRLPCEVGHRLAFRRHASLLANSRAVLPSLTR